MIIVKQYALHEIHEMLYVQGATKHEHNCTYIITQLSYNYILELVQLVQAYYV